MTIAKTFLGDCYVIPLNDTGTGITLSFINKETLDKENIEIKIKDISGNKANVTIKNGTTEINGDLDGVHVAHANDLTYNPITGDLYVCADGDKLIKVNIGNIENMNVITDVVSKVTCDRYYAGIAYIGEREATDENGNVIKDVGYYVGLADKIYIFRNKLEVNDNSVTINYNAFEEVKSYEFSSNLTAQGIGYNNGKVYLTYMEGRKTTI